MTSRNAILEQKRSVLGHALYVVGLRLTDGKLLIVGSRDSLQAIIEDYGPICKF